MGLVIIISRNYSKLVSLQQRKEVYNIFLRMSSISCCKSMVVVSGVAPYHTNKAGGNNSTCWEKKLDTIYIICNVLSRYDGS